MFRMLNMNDLKKMHDSYKKYIKVAFEGLEN